MSKRSAIEDIYPLAPLQEGMLFHALYAPESGVYVGQFGFVLEGPLDPDALERAWQGTVQRHEVLRAAFAWEGVPRPVQVIRREATLPFRREDWRGLDPAEQQARLERFLAEDRAEGFDLKRAPLMRLALIRQGEQEHRLVWTHHHLILDGWSLSLLFRDVLALYQAYAQGSVPQLAQGRRYRDYVAWLERQDRDGAERFWRRALAGFAAPTPLPAVQARRGGEEGHGAATLLLSPERTEALRERARRWEVTPSTLVQGAWALLLGRWAGEEDVVFGATVSGRPPELAGAEETVGLFINTLPVRTRLRAEATLGEWLGGLQREQVEAREYEYAPLVEVQRWSEVPAGEGLFGSLVVFENYPMDAALAEQAERPDGVRVRGDFGREQTNYPLLLTAEAHARLKVELRYDRGVVEDAAARRLSEHLDTVLEAMAGDPGLRLSEVSLLREAERTQLLRAWNATAEPYPRACLHDLVAEQAARTPHDVAVVFAGESLTYAELERGADRLARRLRSRGVGPEVRVGVCAERSLELVVALLAVLKAGGAYVPVDPSHPAERITYVLADSGVPVLLAQERFVEGLAVHGVEVVALEGDGGTAGDEGPEPPAPASSPADLAYVIYTSGSTGRPKGAMNEHRGVVNRLLWMQREYGLDASDVVLQKTPFSFDVSVWELFWPLLAGARLVLAAPEGHRDPVYLAELIEREGVTTLHFVPPMLQAFLDGAEAERCRSLRRVVCSGEALPAELAERFFAALPWSRLHNLYGPTEAAIDVTHHACAPGAGSVVPIGRPVANTQVYVLDPGLDPVPVGVSGELYVGGVQVGRGYLGRPGLTAERFVPDPYGVPGGRLYRTGDRARWLASGEVEYLGRTDFQVKVRGFRVEPGEIEAALLGGGRVREAVVVQREDAPGERRLVAYVVPADGAELSTPVLRAHLLAALPEHMVPGSFVFLESIPLTPNGKVDRRALPRPEREAAGRVAPRTATEEVLCGVWAEVLDVEDVGVGDDFFELGGHSLLATRVVSRARQALGVEVPLRAVFEARTVAALAGRIDALRSGGAPPAPPIRRAPRDGPMPLSFAQQRLWVVDRLEPGSPAYNMPFALRLRGGLDAAALRAGLDELVRRHESLRTVFAEHDGMPVQVVQPPAPHALPAIDLGGLPAPEREALRLAGEEAMRPFDLARGPLLRSTLLRLADDDHVLCFTLHHVVGDAWSMDVLVREVSALYDAAVRGESSPLPELPVQYADYAVWQRARLGGDELEVQVAWWKERLAGAPPLLEIPTDRPRAAGQGARAGTHRFALAAEASRGLRSLARREGATLFMTVLAAWQALLGRYAGQDDVVVGSPVAGRGQVETEGLIGFFVNMLPLRTDLGGEPTWRELLSRVRTGALGAYAHQDVPFERLVDELAGERSLTHAPVFQAVLAVQRPGREPLSLGDVGVQPFGEGPGSVKLDLELSVEDGDGALAGSLVYREALFDPGTAERMAAHLAALLDALAADPQRRPSELSLLRGPERAQVLEGWNATASELPRACVHELFAGQAARAPGAPAVLCGGDVLGYGELERRANRLAHLLLRRGVGLEARVAVCMERGIEVVVALLGVLKAGGAYVPLDPSHPAGRLGEVLRDAGAALVLTHAAAGAQPPAGVEALWLDDPATAAELRAMPETAPGIPSDPAQLACVVYTSGSTGRPKGVALQHAGVARLVRGTGYVRFGPEERIGQVSNLAFDAATFEIWGALLNGGSLATVEREVTLSPAAFAAELRAKRISTVLVTTALFNRIAHEEPGTFAGLRHVLFGGDAADPESVRRVLEAGGPGLLLNAYGPTEITTIATTHAVRRVDAGAATVPIGRPIANTRVYVLDGAGQPAPVGVPGELLLGGVGVARGYLGQPGQTAERFVPDPFGAAGARAYRTGDRVRWRAPGELEYLGRMDAQVKVRGFRVEPGEVEAALTGLPAVREAAVVAREDAPGHRRLVAYVVPEAGHEAPGATLRQQLSERLPEYMVPGAFVVLEELPLNANGKVDRRALPAPERGGPEDGYVAPRTETEAVLGRIWAEVLRVDRVGTRESFFELGGDSILTIQVVSRARRLGLELTPRQLFEHPTIARLAEVVGAAGPRAAAAAQGLVTGEAPLTPVQRRFFARPNARRSHYNQALLLRPREALDTEALARAAAALEAHHDALRLRFRQEEDGSWTQSHAAPGMHPPLTVLDLSRVPGAARGGAIEAAAEQVQRSLDLSRGPLLRMAWLDLGTGEPGRLLAVVHHLAVDGVSWRILLEDLESAYGQTLRGEAVRLPAKTTSWKAWAERLAEHASGAAVEEEAAYWTARSRVAAGPLPVDDAGAENTVSLARSVTVRLGEEETEALLREVPAAYRTQVDEVLLCALAGALRRWTGERRIRIDLEGHGREEEAVGGGVDVSRTVGWFTSVYPVVLELPEAHEPGAALKAVKEQLRGVPGRGIGYGLLRYPAGGGEHAELAGAAQAEVAFNYLGQFDQSVSGEAFFAFAPESAGAPVDGRSPRDHLLEVTGAVREGRLELHVRYAEGAHRRGSMERLAAWYAGELRALVAHCRGAEAGGCTPSDFPLAGLDQAALDSLPGGGRGLEDVYPLTPMQEGILFHTLYAPGSGVYVGQSSFVLDGPLHEDALERAWQGVVARHEALRAGFAWEGVPRPVQLIHREAAVPFRRMDWRGLDGGELRARLDEHLARDRAEGFDPARAPLIRLALVRLGEREHRLVWTHHHLVLDGWSVPLIFRDVLALYAAYARGEAPRAEPAQRYRDYVAWLERQDRSRAASFWRAELAGFGAPTRLPVSGAGGRDGGGGPAGVARTVVSGAEMGALRELAQGRGVTLSTQVQGAWALLLSRYAGEDDVVFGATVSGRPPELPGAEAMVGLFINTLPVRVRIDPAATVQAWLEALRDRQVDAREHDHSPLVEVKRWSGVPDGESLFESLVVFENYPLDPAPAEPVEGLSVRTMEGIDQASYPLLLAAQATSELTLELRYDRGVLDPEAAERLVDRLGVVLAGMAAAPRGRLSEVSLLRDTERAQLLAASRAEGAGHAPACVHELFSAQAARTPGLTAVAAGGRALSYAELELRSGRLAQRLRARGVGPEARVGICLERGVELVVAVLAVLKAGGAYVPLDPAYPAERLAYSLADSGAALLVSRSRLLEALPAFRGEVLCLDAEPEPVPSGPDGAPAGGVEPRNAAYVIYTSGSTGRPKGVVVEHAGLAGTLLAARDTFGLSAGGVMPALASCAFDIWAFEVFVPLLSGGQVLLLPRETVQDVERLVEELAAVDAVDAVHAVPALMREVVQRVQAGPGALPRVRRVFVGGDVIAPDLLERTQSAFPGAQVWAMYGPTEASILASATAPRRGAGCDWRMVGRPLPGVGMHVVDAAGGLLPAGVPGELWLAGAGVARGYLGRPGLTAAAFVPDPFTAEPGARLYRTGDRVRRRPDGEMEFLGRTDAQVKIRGFRIEPGEIEATLLEHAAVRDAAVAVREDAAGHKRLVAYVVPEDAAERETTGLRAHLRERLPDYMVPGAIVVLDALPLSANGKVDRRALPAPEHGEAATHVAPRTPAEELLAGIWAEVLGVDRVGMEQGFFELGGHSLLAMQVAARVRQALGVELPLRELFEAPTASALAGRIEALRGAGGRAAPPLGRIPRTGPLAASFAQQRLWLVDRLDPGSAAYNVPAALRLRGALDLRAMRASLDGVVARHETLRTRFADHDGAPVQVVRPAAPVPLPVVDLRALPEEGRGPEAERLARAEALLPFDLARGPLLRSTLLRLGEQDHVLCFTMHHVVSDAWSMDVLVREVSALYDASSREEEADLPELAVQYADYAAWQREWLAGGVLDKQIGWWRERLAGAPPLLELPTDRPRAAVHGPRAASHRFVLPPRLSHGLRELSRREGTTLFMTVLAAWQALLGRYAGQDDVVVGSPIAGRTRHETEALIGFFVNMLALRARLDGEPTWRELLGRVRETALGAYDHQELPFERLVEELATERSFAHTPLFQVTFSLAGSTGASRLELAGLSLEPFGGGGGAAQFDLDLTCLATDDGLAGTLTYRAALFEADTIARMAGHLEAVLEAMAAEPARRASELSLLRGPERARVLEEWNATAREVPRACIHELFARQAARTPAAPAAVFRGEALSYADLDAQANRLAHALRRRGVGPEVRVGIGVDRGPAMVRAILGVLKAGGAYVPLDPAYPAERAAFMLRDSGALLLLTEAGLAGRFAGSGVPVLALDALDAEIAAQPAGAPESGALPENLAYVIYTSGSTGRPKGVAVAHGALVNYAADMAQRLGLEAGDRFLQFASPGFDVVVEELFPTWLAGAATVLSREELFVPETLLRAVSEEGVTAFELPTAYWHEWVRELAQQRRRLPESVRFVLVGGERVSAERLREWAELGVPLVHVYGLTETACTSTTLRLEAGEDGSRWSNLPVGRATGNVRLYVLDVAGQPVPAGIAGELLIAGAGLARGYLGRPGLTAERFVPDALSGEPGARAYRTGDRVRWTGTGELEFLGRLDAQVKVRGFRIEPGEIEAALEEHGAVREAVVTVREDVPGQKRLVGYVVPEAGAEVSGRGLREHLGARLPEHMVPGAYVVLERLPLNANGKVERRALPAPEGAGEAEYVAPRTVVEELLCAIWAEVLGVETVGVEDDFFALGGHSLLATQVASRTRETFGVEVPLRDLFEAPTVAALAGSVESRMLLALDDAEVAEALMVSE